jgi:hypothetical protein
MVRSISMFIGAVAVACAAAFVPAPADACDCLRLNEISPAIRREAPFVFEGTVVEIVERSEHTTTTTRDGGRSSVRPLERLVVFEVHAAWNGVAQTRISVLAEMSDCVFPFEIGGRYVVFANRHASGKAETSICTRTADSRKAGPILRALGPPAYRPAER